MGNDNQKRKKRTLKTDGTPQRIKELGSIKNLMEINIRAARTEIIHYTEKYPNDMFGFHLYGRIEESLGNLKEAEILYKKVAESNEKNKYSAIIRLGDIARKLGEFTKAKDYYRKAILESPNEERYAIHSLAKLERHCKNYEEAINVLKMLEYPDERTKIEVVKILAAQGRILEAKAVLKSIVPTTVAERREYELENGKLARHEGAFLKAKIHFANVFDTGIKDDIYCKALHEMALIELATQNYQDAIAYCEESLTLGESFNQNVNLTQGLAQQELGIYDKAMANYKETSKSCDFDTRTKGYYFLGNLEFAKGDYEEAVQSLLKSTEGERIPPRAASIKIIAIYIKLGKYQEAEDYITELINIDKEILNDPSFIISRLLLDKATGKSLPKREEVIYAGRQIIAYDAEDAKRHIRSQHMTKRLEKSTFSSEINIDELFDDVKLQMTDDSCVNTDVLDAYEIDYPNVGYDKDNNLTNRLRVVTVPETMNIITMYPSNKTSSPRQSDIINQIEQSKGKQNSRISKFNARFAKFNKQ